ncbi:Uncharacterised protein [Mycobacterium tuberculosis]|nr:Uncharacterised protein [Mycobacterium tuberculosis]
MLILKSCTIVHPIGIVVQLLVSIEVSVMCRSCSFCRYYVIITAVSDHHFALPDTQSVHKRPDINVNVIEYFFFLGLGQHFFLQLERARNSVGFPVD